MNNIKVIVTLYAFVIGLCFGSFALATAWRIKKKRSFTRERSECEHCRHLLAAKDLVPLFSWLSQHGKCRYCHKKLSKLLPLSELTGGLVFAALYLAWPEALGGVLNAARFVLWGIALVLLLILFFYDLQWYILPNKVIYPLWAVSAIDFALRFMQTPTLKTVVMGCAAVAVGAGLFWLFYIVSKGAWIGFGDVRLGIAIGLLLGKPELAAVSLFLASLLGILVALPSLLTKKRNMTSKLPFGPLLIVALIITRLFGAKIIAWYVARVLFI